MYVHICVHICTHMYVHVCIHTRGRQIQVRNDFRRRLVSSKRPYQLSFDLNRLFSRNPTHNQLVGGSNPGVEV